MTDVAELPRAEIVPAGEDIAERLKQCPRIEDARILAPGDRVAEIVVPVSLRDDILAALSDTKGDRPLSLEGKE